MQTEAITDPDSPTIEEEETSIRCTGPILVPYGLRKYNLISWTDANRERREEGEKSFPKVVWMLAKKEGMNK